MKLETSTDIAGSPAAVWDLLVKPNRYTDFMQPADEMIDAGDGIVKQGYTYKVRGGIPPIKSVMTWTVTEFDPKSRQVHVGDDGKAKIRAGWTITPADAGSRLAHAVELTPVWYLAPVMAVMWSLMMRKRTQEFMDQTMANVKRIVEGASA